MITNWRIGKFMKAVDFMAGRSFGGAQLESAGFSGSVRTFGTGQLW
jgi:hypothetical protein